MSEDPGSLPQPPEGRHEQGQEHQINVNVNADVDVKAVEEEMEEKNVQPASETGGSVNINSEAVDVDVASNVKEKGGSVNINSEVVDVASNGKEKGGSVNINSEVVDVDVARNVKEKGGSVNINSEVVDVASNVKEKGGSVNINSEVVDVASNVKNAPRSQVLVPFPSDMATRRPSFSVVMCTEDVPRNHVEMHQDAGSSSTSAETVEALTLTATAPPSVSQEEKASASSATIMKTETKQRDGDEDFTLLEQQKRANEEQVERVRVLSTQQSEMLSAAAARAHAMPANASKRCQKIEHLPRTVQWKIQWNMLVLPHSMESDNGNVSRRVNEVALGEYNAKHIQDESTRVEFLLERHLYNNRVQQQKRKSREKLQQQDLEEPQNLRQQQTKETQDSIMQQQPSSTSSAAEAGNNTATSTSAAKRRTQDPPSPISTRVEKSQASNAQQKQNPSNCDSSSNKQGGGDSEYYQQIVNVESDDDVEDISSSSSSNDDDDESLEVGFPSQEDNPSQEDDENYLPPDPFSDSRKTVNSNEDRFRRLSGQSKASVSETWQEFYSNKEVIDLIDKDLKRLPTRLIFWQCRENENKNPAIVSSATITLPLLKVSDNTAVMGWGEADDEDDQSNSTNDGSIDVSSALPGSVDEADGRIIKKTEINSDCGEVTPEEGKGESPLISEEERQEKLEADNFASERQQMRTERLKMMKDLLFGYAKEYPEIGYRQGMHEILAHVFLALELDLVDHGNMTFVPNQSSRMVGLDGDGEGKQQDTLLLSRANLRSDAYLLFEAWMEGLKPAYDDTNNREASEAQKQGGSAQLGQRILTLTSYGSADVCNLLEKMSEEMGAPPQLFCAKWMRLVFSREIDSRIHVLEFWDALLHILYDPWNVLWNTPALQHRVTAAMTSKSKSTVDEAKAMVNSKLSLLDVIECAACSMILLQRKTLLHKLKNCDSNSNPKVWARAMEMAVHDCLSLMMNYPSMSDINELAMMTTRVSRFHLEHMLKMITPRKSTPRATVPQNGKPSTQASAQAKQANFQHIKRGNSIIGRGGGSGDKEPDPSTINSGPFLSRMWNKASATATALESAATGATKSLQEPPPPHGSPSEAAAAAKGLPVSATSPAERQSAPLQMQMPPTSALMGESNNNGAEQQLKKLQEQMLVLSAVVGQNLNVLRDYVMEGGAKDAGQHEFLSSAAGYFTESQSKTLEKLSSLEPLSRPPEMVVADTFQDEARGSDPPVRRISTDDLRAASTTKLSSKRKPSAEAIQALEQLHRAQQVLALCGKQGNSTVGRSRRTSLDTDA
jgi:hypothetical protein